MGKPIVEVLPNGHLCGVNQNPLGVICDELSHASNRVPVCAVEGFGMVLLPLLAVGIGHGAYV